MTIQLQKKPILVLQILADMGSGGVERMLYNYFMHMDHSKIVFDFIVHVPEPGMFECLLSQYPCRFFHLPRFRHVIVNFLKTRQIIKAGHYQIVHVHHTAKSFPQLLAAWSCGVKTRIAHSHDCVEHHGLVKLLYRLYGFLTTSFATHFFACSNLAGYFVFGSKIHSSRYRIVRNAIETNDFAFNPDIRAQMRKRLGLDDRFAILNVGRFAEQKNHRRILDIFLEILIIRPNSVLLLIGKGELEDSIRRYAHDLGLENHVRFVGETNNVSEFMQAADILLFPSLHEGLGIVLIEAQTSGMPCFASLGVIPAESDITGLVHFLSLEESDSKWANEICRTSLQDRQDHSVQIRENGYDIAAEAQSLETWYMEQ